MFIAQQYCQYCMLANASKVFFFFKFNYLSAKTYVVLFLEVATVSQPKNCSFDDMLYKTLKNFARQAGQTVQINLHNIHFSK